MPVLGGTDNHTHEKKVIIPHTWAISGDVKAASGDTDFLLPFYVTSPTGQVVKLRGGRAKINSGTSVDVAINVNDAVVITSQTVVVGGTTLVDPNYTFTAGAIMRVNPIVAAPVGSPKNLNITLFLEYTF